MDAPTQKMDKSSVTDSMPLPITLPDQPLQPWLRLALVARWSDSGPAKTGRVRHIRDYEFIFQYEGTGWIWSELTGTSLRIKKNSLVFLPPGFVHAWGYERGAHIADHFALHANRVLQPQKNLQRQNRRVAPNHANTCPHFSLHTPGKNQSPLVLPLVMTIRRPDVWHHRLHHLVQLY